MGYRKEIYRDGKVVSVFDNRDLKEEKALKILDVKSFSKNILNETDWNIIKAQEEKTEIKEEVIFKRKNIRLASDKAEDSINSCEELIELDQCNWMTYFNEYQ